MVHRIYVEKKSGHDVEAQGIYADLTRSLSISGLTSARLINRYDVEGIDEITFAKSQPTIFSEPMVDTTFFDLPQTSGRILAVEYLPGQYDVRADSCAQCIQLMTHQERPAVKSAKIYIFEGQFSDDEFDKIKGHIINPVEAREASLENYTSLKQNYVIPEEVETLDSFIALERGGLEDFLSSRGLAMDIDDLLFCQSYFRDEERRDPTITEIRLIDSYWSDHCRHTTFLTAIDKIAVDDDYVKSTFDEYLKCREFVYPDKKNRPVTLMDMATLAAKYLKKKGGLKNLDESEEINACSIKINVTVNGQSEPWLLMFKNETHNHPTEIEPFGGAATCLGGAIRDPLSGRSYVYQAMRVTGAADPRVPASQTLKGKLPQSKITVGAAQGYSSYGNQIGLSTGHVNELYHPDYVAKRLEIGAVIGAAPERNVVRTQPIDGDIVILLGGRTGRDGCGGATGSSKAHTVDSTAECGAEVQKGNPVEERKIQRLFRNPAASTLIKRCNDFGAGGVSVAIGELADGLEIDLSKVPKKYDGLDGTELAISESQERMAVVVSPSNADEFCRLAAQENLESTVVAHVTAEPRLKMMWNGKEIVSMSRGFLNSNGVQKHTSIEVGTIDTATLFNGLADYIDEETTHKALISMVSDLNICSQRGLVERFDSTNGAATVIMPYGGRYQKTPAQFMAAKIPVENGETNTASVMAYGFNPYLSKKSPYHGALYAVIESVTRLVAAGCDFKDAYLTLQEYFPRTQNDPKRWGLPFAAMMGAFRAQTALGIAAIGGKDSMSGTFENIDVPPTLVSFAVGVTYASSVITPEFKKAGSKVYLLRPLYDKNKIVNFDDLKRLYGYVSQMMANRKILSCQAVGFGGIAEALVKMSFGNKIGLTNMRPLNKTAMFQYYYGSFIVETDEVLQGDLLGMTADNSFICMNNNSISIDELLYSWEGTLERVFPTTYPSEQTASNLSCALRSNAYSAEKFAKPRVVIPVFPGTNCEYDSQRQFTYAGADAKILVLRNATSDQLEESCEQLAQLIASSQILMFPGGFSGGDEPDGSAKFITAVLRNPRIKEEVNRLLKQRGGLALGICNGFQALVKTGLLPYGEILDEMQAEDATLTFNKIARHQSRMVDTRIASVKSPWLMNAQLGDIHTIPVSHGEGRFTADPQLLSRLIENGQIATQYVDKTGHASMNPEYNPNGSDMAIEGILSPDGRVFGKMGHSERIGSYVAKNIPGSKDQRIFASGVAYFK